MRINISIDDVSPHPLSSTRVLDRCFEIIKIHSEAKFTLFVPVSYWRTVRQEARTQKPLQINQFPDFCEFLRELPEKNFEICYHGLYHGIPGISDNDEFRDLSYKSAVDKFEEMFQIVELSGLSNRFKKIFRPPAWRMSPGAIEAARDCGIKTLALSPEKYAKDTYGKLDESFSNVVYYDVNPPFNDLPTSPTRDKLEIVYHACEWDRNYLSNRLKDDLIDWLKRQQDPRFVFIEDL